MESAFAAAAAAARRGDWDGAAAAALAATAHGAVPRAAAPMLAGLVRELRKAERIDTARAVADAFVRAAPDEPAAWLGRSEVAHRQGDLPLAIADTRAAMARAANPRAGAPRLVQLLQEAGWWDEAITAAEAALAADPGDLEIMAMLADVEDAAGRPEDAARTIARALARRAERGFGSPQLLMSLFRAGRLDAAIADLELRWSLSGAPPRPFPQPAWDGGALPDETLLVWGEQGLGEEIWA
ncbi:MAG: tetratricopeptide repeat protein, partial [Alphaproteobacteria bacterium]